MSPILRPHVAESWLRSAAAGVGVERLEAPITLPGGVLRDYREAHPLARAFPAIDDVLGQMVRDSDAIMAVADEQGQLLWVCGDQRALRRGESIGFVEGSNWDERLAGTNAPGMALVLGRPVSVNGQEHFRRSVRQWSCAATPVFHPVTRRLLGVIDITGGAEIVGPATLAALRATARLAEAEVAQDHRLPHLDVPRSGRLVRLESLGRPEALLSVHDRSSSPRHTRLSPRHSEILVLLASAPNGLSGDELMTLLYEEDVTASTLRAEVNRLRSLVGEELLRSRPYRLAAEVSGDWLDVETSLLGGNVADAVRGYRGPMLPRSVAPGVVRLREGLSSTLRHAVLATADPQLMATWTRASWGADDYDMWQAQRAVLSPSSPLAAMVTGQIARLDEEFGA